MPEQIDIDDVLRKNNLDPQALEESRKLLRMLRQSGLRGDIYDLASPIDRHRAAIGDSAEPDCRTAHLNAPDEDESNPSQEE